MKNILLKENWKLFCLDPERGFLEGAYKKKFTPKEFAEVALPKTASAAWLEAGKIPDPFFGKNNLNTLWMEEKEWWYLRDFELPKSEEGWEIVFHGANYRAEAWVNGVALGQWKGSFLKKSFRLDPKSLHLEKHNRLAVRVRAQELAWLDGSVVKPEKGSHDSTRLVRTQAPTPQYAHGWNWSPHHIAVGLWRPVELRFRPTARLTNARFFFSLGTGFKTGKISFTAEIKNTGTRANAGLALELKSPQGKKIFAKAYPVAVPADSKKKFRFDFVIKNPELWWPNGYGRQPLYTANAELILKKKTIDKHVSRQGFRKVEMIANLNDEAILKLSGQTNRMWSIVGKPYPWTLRVNGKRIFIKGTNWCPSDNLYREGRPRLERFLRLAAKSHSTMLRVWGGGLTEGEDFYDLCDELGLVVFQEFWLACGSYPGMDQDGFVESARSEMLRLRERTCLAWWGGGNEFDPNTKENKPLIDSLETLAGEVDGKREFRRGSPYKGDRHGGLVYLPHRTTNKYRDLLPGKKRIVLLRSEMAVGRSPMRPENLKKFIPEKSLWPIDWDQYQYHHARKSEWEVVTRPFGKTDEWHRELLNASVMHAVDNRMNMEYTRLHKYESSGCLSWQLNGSWPSFHREHIDWYGQAKSVFYYYQNAMRPVILCADIEKLVFHPGETIHFPLFIVNDLHQKFSGQWSWKILSLDGKKLAGFDKPLTTDIPADASLPLKPIQWKVPANLAESAFYLELQMEANGETFHNLYWLAVSPDTRAEGGLPLDSFELDYLGAKKKVRLPHYFFLPQGDDELTEEDDKKALVEKKFRKAVYRTTFDLPGMDLTKSFEVFVHDLSGDDEIRVNGQPIGRTELAPDERNYRADPLRWPTLPIRFYDIPQDLLKEKGNRIEISVNGERMTEGQDQCFGLAEKVFIREKTPDAERMKIRRYFKETPFFIPIAEGPKAELKIVFTQTGPHSHKTGTEYAIRIENISKIPAAFVNLDLEGSGDTLFHFSEGAFSLSPGGALQIHLRIEGPLPKGCRLRSIGLNVVEKYTDFP